MAHYIDKDALVAEIERRKDICKKVILDLRTQENKEYYQGKAEAYKETLDFFDTLEVKEVDLDREMQAFALLYLEPLKISNSNIGISITMAQLYSCAKHFFELGLKAQKGE